VVKTSSKVVMLGLSVMAKIMIWLVVVICGVSAISQVYFLAVGKNSTTSNGTKSSVPNSVT